MIKSMPRFSLKDILRGMTLASIGCAMLAIALRGYTWPTTQGWLLLRGFLIAFGGTFVGYGLAFPIKYPPHQMMFGMIGMFAATAWDSGSSVGLLVYLGAITIMGGARLIANRRAKPDAAPPDTPTQSE